MKILRMFRHLLRLSGQARRRFPPATMHAIATAIRTGEARHRGEIRFAIEDALPLSYLRRGAHPRERALMVFGKLRVWDTEHNTGVLIYLNLADRDVEIVADRGVAHVVGSTRWEAICKSMEAEFRAGRWREGAVAGIEAVSDAIAAVLPAAGPRANEVPDRPVIL